MGVFIPVVKRRLWRSVLELDLNNPSNKLVWYPPHDGELIAAPDREQIIAAIKNAVAFENQNLVIRGSSDGKAK